MPWLERPAAVYVDVEVVLHCVPPVAVEKAGVVYEVGEMRVEYRFDAATGRWSHRSSTAFGYRRSTRQGSRVETPLPTGHADLVRLHAPRWVPDPSKPVHKLTDDEVRTLAMTREQAELIRRVRGTAQPVTKVD